ncbi:MAG: hypothetical protein Q9168_002764 [Polycauliona sp. 1 TL-2023]
MRLSLRTFTLASLAFRGTHAAKWDDITSSANIQLAPSGSYSPLIAPLDSTLNNVSLDEIVADANHAMTIKSGKYKWSASSDFNDFDTESWYPQGITSSADAGDAKYNKNHLILVSWYAKEDSERGVRISFINTSVSPPKYRHVLLVEPTGAATKPSFKGVGVHAGGIAWYGNMLYIADTDAGVRLFDMDHMYKVQGGDGVGRQSNGDYHAYGYNIVFGEYYHKDQGPISRVARFDLDSNSHLLTVNKDDIATASKVFHHGEPRVQGAISVTGRYFLSQSNGDDGDSDIIGFTPGAKDSKEYRVLPPGSEDLTYDKAVDTLWTLTEHAGDRYIVGTPVKDISS